MNLARWSVRQAVLVNLIFVICLFAGLFSFARTPVDFFPDISFNTTLVSTVWLGAPAEEVERLVTAKIEEEILDITGIKEIRSYSSADSSNISVNWIESLSDDEYTAALADLRAAVDRVTELPEDAEEPIIRELSIAEVRPALMVAVADTAGLGEVPLRQIAEDLKSRLEDVPGVEKVVVRGQHDRELRVLVDRDAAARHGLDVVEIANRIRRTNLNLPAGTFSGSDGESTLRATNDYRSVEELLDTVVVAGEAGNLVRVRDVAEVEQGLEKRRFISRYNGDPALVLGVVKRKEDDVRAVSERVSDFVATLQPTMPEGIELSLTWDTSQFVTQRMTVLSDNLVAGVLLVMAILWVTLGFRNALLTIIAIPFSFLTAFIFFPLFDMTINSLSLVGMLLVSGMLVDDAIIVLENIYRRIEEGEPLERAIIEGTSEVMWPVIAAVSTTIAAFLPLLMVSGTSGEFMSLLPKAVIVCLIASLLECLVVLPAHYLDFGSRGHVGAGDAPAGSGPLAWIGAGVYRVRGLVDAAIDGLRRGYLRALDVVLANAASFAVLFASMVVFSVLAATHIPVNMFPTESTTFYIAVEAPTDYGLEQTNALVKQVEAEIEPLLGEHLVDFSTYVGNSLVSGGQDQRAAPNLAIIYAWITPTPEYRLAPEKAVALVQSKLDALSERVGPGGGFERLSAELPREGPPIGKPVAVRIESEDYALNKAVALEMQAFLSTLPGVFNVDDNLDEGPREIRLIVDEARAGRHKLSFEDLARALQGANDGIVASGFREPSSDDDVDIRVLLQERFRGDVRDLLRTELRTPGGYLVEIGEVADVEVSRGYVSLVHLDGKRNVTVYADVDGNLATSLSANRALATEFADVKSRFPSLTVTYGGEFQDTERTFSDIGAAGIISLLAIYTILAAVFRSYLQPLIILTAVPMGLVGVIGGIGLLGYQISMMMAMATVGMFGVAVNDALVMVSFVNRAREGGLSVREAVRQSGAIRLRPILLTTLTTVGALLPMALGIQGTSKSYGPFAASIAFGLMAAMVGTLFVVPLSYTLLASFQDGASRRLRRWSGRPERDRTEATEPALAGQGARARSAIEAS